MSTALKIGMIGLDTSHVTAFADILNNTANPHHVAGATVTAAFPGGSPDFPLSANRVKGFTDTLRDKYNVKMLESIDAVAAQSDIVFIESVDGRVHLEQFRQVVKHKKPVFIDKPFTVNGDEAAEIFKLAKSAGVPVMSASSLRYGDEFAAVCKAKRATLRGFDAYGPMSIEPTQGGLFWYGIHTVEMIVTAMGPDAVEVRAYSNENHDTATITFADGRVATLHGVRSAHGNFGCVFHEVSGATFCDAYGSSKVPPYALMMREVLANLPHGKSGIPEEETLAVIRIIDACNESRGNGKIVKVKK
jgi:predicted dehydrogenase